MNRAPHNQAQIRCWRVDRSGSHGRRLGQRCCALRPQFRGVLLLALAVLAACSGCQRGFYRRQADAECYTAVEQYSLDPRWPLPGYTIDVHASPWRRVFDPTSPDRPAMPPDDPTSHQLMHWVDGKKGWKHWHRNGDIPYVDAGLWRNYLPYDEKGRAVVDVESAVLLALASSRDYQTELEDLYISALDVTFERFQFDTQFFGGTETLFTADGRARPGGGGQSSSLLTQDNFLEARRFTATGGDFVVGLANALVWEFSGPNVNSASTLVDFSFIQPLLRFGGRVRALEGLTKSERDLLANVRQMEQFRQGFYTQIVSGRDAGDGPVANPGLSGVGAGGLGFTANVGSGTGAATVGGVLGLLQQQQVIRNLEANVAALRDSLHQLEAAFDANRIPNLLQVEQARQALYNGQSRLLSARAAYESRLDAFKLTLGLPPGLDMVVEDDLLTRFNLLDESITTLRTDLDPILTRARRRGGMAVPAALGEILADADALYPRVEEQLAVLDRDFARLLDQLETRRSNLRKLNQLREVLEEEVDPRAYSEEALLTRVERIRSGAANLHHDLEVVFAKLDALEPRLQGPLLIDLLLQPVDASALVRRIEQAHDDHEELRDLLTELSGLLLDLSLAQAASRLDAVVMEPIEIDDSTALAVARANRRDWMNARAALVDSWRLIEFQANTLRSGLNLRFEGDIRTLGDNPVQFRDTTGRMRMGVAFDAPLTRLAERNNYRLALIQYQRSRRSYMLFEDRVQQSLRNTLRILALNQLNFELRRSAVYVAITQVDLARLRLNQPPKPGESSQFGATTARDLLSALSDLLDAQNDFLGVWVSYETLRMGLDLELGTMQLDDRGLWIDPGSFSGLTRTIPAPGDELEEVPPVEELPFFDAHLPDLLDAPEVVAERASPTDTNEPLTLLPLDVEPLPIQFEVAEETPAESISEPPAGVSANGLLRVPIPRLLPARN